MSNIDAKMNFFTNMKTSYLLLAVLAFVTLTGMVATDVLLKQQYDKIDWSNPYQNFEQRTLPDARHWVVEGAPTVEIIVLMSADKPQALIDPQAIRFCRIRQQGDTVFVALTPDYSGYQSQPRDDIERQVQLVLRLPNLQTLHVKNGRMTLRGFFRPTLAVSLTNSRLRTDKLIISDAFDLIARQNSYALLGADQYKALQTTVQDSSGVQLNDTQVETLTTKLSPKADIQLRGRALKWLR